MVVVLVGVQSCNIDTSALKETASTGVKKAQADIAVGTDGLTTEQCNVKKRLEEDNKPGALKHLYVISAMSGQVLIYSTVDGKVTSSGKRLTSPVTFKHGDRGESGGDFVVPALQDDGTHGSSVEYVYWWDSKGVYHQHYITGGQIFHVTSKPLAIKNITINMELASNE